MGFEYRIQGLSAGYHVTFGFLHSHSGIFSVLLENKRQFEQARQLGEETLARCRQTLGDDHPHTLTTANSLAVTLLNGGQFRQAHQLAEDTYAPRRRVLGEDHPDTLRSANSLATALQELGQQDRAVNSPTTPTPACVESWARDIPTLCAWRTASMLARELR